MDIEEARGECVYQFGCGAVGAAGVDPDDLCVVDQDLGIVNISMRRQEAACPQRCLHFLRFLPGRHLLPAEMNWISSTAIKGVQVKQPWCKAD
jgi:hypothetical protein